MATSGVLVVPMSGRLKKCVFCIKWEKAIIIHINGPIIPEEIASHNPHVTDNDLPPLNFKKGENILPVIAETQIKNNPIPSKSFFKAIFNSSNAYRGCAFASK